MDNDVYTYSLEKTEKYDRDGTYGMVDGEPVKLERNWGFFGLGAYNYYLDANGKEVKYTGDLYHKVGRETGKTRLDVAKEALNSLADQLIASNDSTVKLSLETFSDRGNTPSQYYAGGQASDFKDAVNGLRADGGTNWVDALTKANAKANEDPTLRPTSFSFLMASLPMVGTAGELPATVPPTGTSTSTTPSTRPTSVRPTSRASSPFIPVPRLPKR